MQMKETELVGRQSFQLRNTAYLTLKRICSWKTEALCQSKAATSKLKHRRAAVCLQKSRSSQSRRRHRFLCCDNSVTESHGIFSLRFSVTDTMNHRLLHLRLNGNNRSQLRPYLSLGEKPAGRQSAVGYSGPVLVCLFPHTAHYKENSKVPQLWVLVLCSAFLVWCNSLSVISFCPKTRGPVTFLER